MPQPANGFSRIKVIIFCMTKTILLTISVIIMSIFSSAQNKAEMTIEELKNEIKNNPNLIILDVRNPDELEGHLGKLDSVINIPVQDLEERIGELEKYKGKDVAVICRTGNRSHYGTQYLNSIGFKAKNVLGGMVQYRREED